MFTSSKRLVALGLAMSAMVVAGCGSDSDSDTTSSAAPAGSTSTAAAAPAAKKIKVGLVTDIGGLNDRSFNALANKGLEDAKSSLGIDGRVLTSKANSDYVPNLSSLAQQKYDLIIGVGFLMADAVGTVAKKFPNTNFAIIDNTGVGLKGKPANVRGLLFSEQEAGYLAGVVAGSYAKDNDISTISSVGGQEIPPVVKYIAGYQAGAKSVDPQIKTLNDYSKDFVKQATCKEIGLNQIDQGSGIVFQVAGQCGLGALDAAKEKGKLGIGVDADQGYLGSYILTSAQKKIDVAVVNTIKAVQDGSFQGNADETFDVKTDGVAIGKLSADGTKYQAAVDEAKKKIAAGEVEIPTELK